VVAGDNYMPTMNEKANVYSTAPQCSSEAMAFSFTPNVPSSLATSDPGVFSSTSSCSSFLCSLDAFLILCSPHQPPRTDGVDKNRPVHRGGQNQYGCAHQLAGLILNIWLHHNAFACRTETVYVSTSLWRCAATSR